MKGELGTNSSIASVTFGDTYRAYICLQTLQTADVATTGLLCTNEIRNANDHINFQVKCRNYSNY